MKITYYVQRYRPAYEAISKEIQLLARHFSVDNKVKIHDLHLDGILKWRWNPQKISYHFAYYPLLFLYTKLLSRSSAINHIYTSLGDLPYLPVITLKNTVITAAASCTIDKVKKRLKFLQELPFIVTETEVHKQQLEELGIPHSKIKLIYPPVDLSSFSYTLAIGKFRILFASCPTRREDFEKRGINLLINAASQDQSEIILLWRRGAEKDIQELLYPKKAGNIILRNGIINDMNAEYAKVHATIIPYTQFDDFLKLIPNSALESLAAGKPLLVSTKTELAKIVQRYKCGVVFEPTSGDLQQAVAELQQHYNAYQKNCRKTAKKLFSQEIFLQKYEGLYKKMTAQKP